MSTTAAVRQCARALCRCTPTGVAQVRSAYNSKPDATCSHEQITSLRPLDGKTMSPATAATMTSPSIRRGTDAVCVPLSHLDMRSNLGLLRDGGDAEISNSSFSRQNLFPFVGNIDDDGVSDLLYQEGEVTLMGTKKIDASQVQRRIDLITSHRERRRLLRMAAGQYERDKWLAERDLELSRRREFFGLA